MKTRFSINLLSTAILLTTTLLTYCSKEIEEVEKIEQGEIDTQSKSTVWHGDLALSDQAAINDIGAFNYAHITGELLIGVQDGFSDITDLSPLSSIKQVGSLDIKRNSNLTTLENLSITNVDDFISIDVNHKLEDLKGLDGLSSIKGGLSISNNKDLVSLDGLEKLTSVGGGLSITNNDILDTDGYSGIYPLIEADGVAGTVNISGNKDNPTEQEILDMDFGSSFFWIPDDNFRSTLKDIVPNAFTPTDSLITNSTSVSSATFIDVSGKNISSLDGVEFFTSLVVLHCEQNDLTSLDLSELTDLKALRCSENNLTSLNLSSNTDLVNLNCEQNALTSLDISNNTNLRIFYCYDNALTSLNVSNNKALKTLVCSDNNLTNLDVSNNKDLMIFACGRNNLTSLDVSNNTNLSTLQVDEDIKCEPSIVELNPINCIYWDETQSRPIKYHPAADCFIPNLFWVADDNFRAALKNIVPNAFTPTDSLITNHTDVLAVTSIKVDKKNITSLDGIQFFTALEELHCNENKLTSLDLSDNTALIRLECNKNNLASLDMSGLTDLMVLWCNQNNLTSLDLSSNTALHTIYCSSNNLTCLDLRNNTDLMYLTCRKNKIIYLNTSNSTNLWSLQCDQNRLTSLDLSNNTAIGSLHCNNNHLVELDVSNNTSLRNFICDNNHLSYLDLSKNTALGYLSCHENDLTSLDVSNNKNLDILSVNKALMCEPSIVSQNPRFCTFWTESGRMLQYRPELECN